MSELKTCKYFTVSKFTQFPVNVKILLFFTTVYNVLRSNILDTNKQFKWKVLNVNKQTEIKKTRDITTL